MRSTFDRRVVPDPVVELVRRCQARVECHLGGGAALSGAYLAHRLSRDVDLFFHSAGALRELVTVLGETASSAGVGTELLRDAGTFVRARLRFGDREMELDLVHEPNGDIEPPPPPLEGVVVESLPDLRASKLTCLLSRSEPRDLVDLLFLERAGHPPELDLALALRKDAGLDPGALAWLLGTFPVEPLPVLLLPLTVAELGRYREDLRERLRRLAVGKSDR